jgi:ribose 5-phosphate isomerase B
MARITIASDHAGYRLKEALIAHLKGAGHDIDDLGTHSEEPVDYPPICAAAGRAVVAGRADFAIVLGGSGQGETMAANKVRGVRAALCHDEYTARRGRGRWRRCAGGPGGRILGEGLAVAIVDEFLSTDFEGGRHARRVAQIADIEGEEAAQGAGGPTG